MEDARPRDRPKKLGVKLQKMIVRLSNCASRCYKVCKMGKLIRDVVL